MEATADLGEACPRCQLPREEDAWRCDGCGHEFRQDFEAVRAELKARVRGAWIELATMIALLGAVVLGLVLLASGGMIYVSVGLVIALFGGAGHAVFKIRTLGEHLRDLERRHTSLPTAVVRE